jgi:prepilin-type N-terminal cleavage/methylation domain-containing protein
MLKNKKKGFTLIELLVVISIIGLLSSVVLVSLNDAKAKARDAKRLSGLKEIQSALELYYAQNNFYPSHTQKYTGLGGILPLAYYTDIKGDNTESVFKTAISPFLSKLPSPSSVVSGDKESYSHSRIMYRRLTNNTVPGCSGLSKNCYSLVIYPETNTSWGTANKATFFLSNGEIRRGKDATLY